MKIHLFGGEQNERRLREQAAVLGERLARGEIATIIELSFIGRGPLSLITVVPFTMESMAQPWVGENHGEIDPRCDRNLATVSLDGLITQRAFVWEYTKPIPSDLVTSIGMSRAIHEFLRVATETYLIEKGRWDEIDLREAAHDAQVELYQREQES